MKIEKSFNASRGNTKPTNDRGLPKYGPGSIELYGHGPTNNKTIYGNGPSIGKNILKNFK